MIDDYTYLWWDVRPHPRLGTVEIRVMDVQFDIDQTLMLAAYIQSSVARAIDEVKLGNLPTAYHRQLVSENKWAAARYGLDALLMDLAGDRARACRPRSSPAAASSGWRPSRASWAAPTRWPRSSARSRGATARRA